MAWFISWQRDDLERRHEFNCAVCQREEIWREKDRICFLQQREAVVDVPTTVRRAGEILFHPTERRQVVTDAYGVLRLASEARRASRAGRRCGRRFWAGEYLLDSLGVCPAYYQFDAVVQEAVHVANLRDGGYPIDELPADFVELVMVAAGTMAEYQSQRIDDQKKRAEAINRG